MEHKGRIEVQTDFRVLPRTIYIPKWRETYGIRDWAVHIPQFRLPDGNHADQRSPRLCVRRSDLPDTLECNGEDRLVEVEGI